MKNKKYLLLYRVFVSLFLGTIICGKRTPGGNSAYIAFGG